MSSSLFAAILAQATTTAASSPAAAPDAAAAQPPSMMFIYMLLFGGVVYFALIRPQSQAKKKQEETVKGAKTGDKVVTSGGIVGIITNVKDTTVIMRSADTKLEIEKSFIDKVTRPDSAEPEKAVVKAS